MKKFKVLTPILHDGQRFSIGAIIELDDASARNLLGLKAIAPADETPVPAKPAEPAEPAEPAQPVKSGKAKAAK